MKRHAYQIFVLLLVFVFLGQAVIVLAMPRALSAPVGGASAGDHWISPVSGAVADSDGYLTLTFRFLVDVSREREIREQSDRFRVYATAGKYDPRVGAPAYVAGGDFAELSSETTFYINTALVRLYAITIYGLAEADYDAVFAARLFLVSVVGGSERVYASPFSEEENVVSLFDAALDTYSDRAAVSGPLYPYRTVMGDYSPASRLEALDACLASRVSVLITENGVVDVYLREKGYHSIYSFHYFDGVLTIFLPNADIPEGVLRHVTVNGVERYFEIYDGKVRLGLL